MNTNGQMGIIGYVFGIIVFLLIDAFFLGKFINDWVQQAILDNGYTGLIAFLLAYMNLWIILLMILGLIVVTRYSSA